jgi:hypothetical protein
VNAAYRKEMLEKESYAYVAKPSFTVRCPEPGCMQEYAVYLDEDAGEVAARGVGSTAGLEKIAKQQTARGCCLHSLICGGQSSLVDPIEQEEQ